MKKSIVSILFLSLFASVALADSGWKEYAQRPAIAPEFEQSDEQNILIIKSNGNVSSNGSWRRDVPVEAGKHYHFSAEYQAEDVPLPRRSILMKVEWLDQNGRRTAYPDTLPYSIHHQQTGSALNVAIPPRITPEVPRRPDFPLVETDRCIGAISPVIRGGTSAKTSFHRDHQLPPPQFLRTGGESQTLCPIYKPGR